MSQIDEKNVSQLVEHLFRHQAGQMVSTLTRYFGVENIDLAEDVVQETLLKALQQWVFRGIPDNPSGWILQSAKNQAIDILRRQTAFRNRAQEIAERLEQEFAPATGENVYLPDEFKDDQLRMIFTCCHPALPHEARVALTLKTLCGFGVTEIARAFLSQEPAIAQRIVRAKRKIRQERIPFEVPPGNEIHERLESVLEVLYLLFNEGYSAHTGEDLIRQDLCVEAIRLMQLLVRHPRAQLPRVHALLALMYLQASRLPARLDSAGHLLLLSEQDRATWDRAMIAQGLHHLEKSASGDELSEYHLQAGIAACHALATDYESTDWSRILSYYDELIDLNQSPVVALNRAVAISMVNGPEEGLLVLDELSQAKPLQSYYLLPATYADFYARMHKYEQALSSYHEALNLAVTAPEKAYLQRRVRECKEKVSNTGQQIPVI